MSHGKARAILIVLDGCGAGPAPDSAEFGDPHAPSTVLHVWEQVPFQAPYLEASGFLAACGVPLSARALPNGLRSQYGRLCPVGMGKDSVTGHWEMMGVHVAEPFPTYPVGFPPELLSAFEAAVGRQAIGNKPASGTEIIRELGPEHVVTGKPIVYTSADSVFQIACHEQVVPLAELYQMCEHARELCKAPHNVQRVIARPFLGDPKAGFTRTTNRKDYPLPAPPNLVDEIGDVFGIGVVPELFGHRGFRALRRTQINREHAAMMVEALESDARFVFANFEDFDMLYGHRNDPEGFARALVEFDEYLGWLLERLQPEEVLILTADHGNDPTDTSTDHTRELVPFVTVGQPVQPGPRPEGRGLWAVGACVAQHLGIPWVPSGCSGC